MRTAKKSLSLQKTISNKKKLANHLGCINLEFDEGLDEATVETFDETYLVIDIDNGRVLKFQGPKRMIYSDVASARD